ncbi:MAG TPA: MBL fold metallo-hydrolase [Mycobacteriales bacterium]
MALVGDVDFLSGAPVVGDLDVRWIHGSPSVLRDTGPRIQVHAHDPHTFVLRQSKTVHFEAPFLYLFCGNERALLLDTGATADPDLFPLRATVDRILGDWLTDHPRDSYELVVAHTHAHGDHVAGDTQFTGREATTVVGRDLDAVRAFFGFEDWPDQVVRFDLGGRVLEVTGCPGHHETSLAVYDPWSGFLVTGDTVYPGRLHVQDMPAFTGSLDRLVAFADARPVTHVMGCHIEMTRTPGRDHPLGATFQPHEPPLQMTTDRLVAVRDAARSVAHRRGVHRYDDFIIFNNPRPLTLAGQLVRALWGRVRNRLTAARGGTTSDPGDA